jgi:hypothetical protein
MMKAIVFGVVMGVAATGGAIHSAQAACFEDVGTTGCTDEEVFPRSDLDQLSCDVLWTIRNTIYHENGYCFSTERGQANFSNDGCITGNANRIRLSPIEQRNISNVRKVEKRRGCR